MKMSPAQWWGAGGFCGIVFVVLFIVGFGLQWDLPKADATGAEIKAYFADDGDKYLYGDFLIGVGFVFFFLPFVWALAGYLEASEPAGEAWSRLVLVYGAILTAVGASCSAFGGALAYQTAEFGDEGLLRAFVQAFYYVNTFAIPLLLAGLTLTVGILINRHGGLPKWLGWLSFAITVLGVISTFAVHADDPEGPLGALGLVGFLLWMVWMLAISFTMLRTESLPVASEAQTVGRS